jgi:hypothetical protein
VRVPPSGLPASGLCTQGLSLSISSSFVVVWWL